MHEMEADRDRLWPQGRGGSTPNVRPDSQPDR
jgi:hypothetical protein